MEADRASRDGGEVTFRGRGLARREGARFVVLVCPLCSQRNARGGAGRDACAWCAYEPSAADAEPVRPVPGTTAPPRPHAG